MTASVKIIKWRRFGESDNTVFSSFVYPKYSFQDIKTSKAVQLVWKPNLFKTRLKREQNSNNYDRGHFEMILK